MSTASQRKRISRLRMVSQRLVGEPWRTPRETVRGMLCMQGQDWNGVLRSIALRTLNRSIGEVRASFAAGEIVRSWPQRGTLHVLAAEDLEWYLQLNARPRLARQERARVARGLTPEIDDAIRNVTVQALRRGECGTRPADEPEAVRPCVWRARRNELISLWRERGLLPEDMSGIYPLHHLCVEGILVQGPTDADGTPLFVLADEWIAQPRRLDRAEAIGELVLRYLASHGPASRRDINWWSTLPLRAIDEALEEHSSSLTWLDVDGERYWYPIDLADRAEAANANRALLLLPGFDELILGYRSRWMTIPESRAADLVPGNNGVFRHSVVLGGKAIGFWRKGRKGPDLELFDQPSSNLARRLELAIERLPDDGVPDRIAPWSRYAKA